MPSKFCSNMNDSLQLFVVVNGPFGIMIIHSVFTFCFGREDASNEHNSSLFGARVHAEHFRGKSYFDICALSALSLCDERGRTWYSLSLISSNPPS